MNLSPVGLKVLRPESKRGAVRATKDWRPTASYPALLSSRRQSVAFLAFSLWRGARFSPVYGN